MVGFLTVDGWEHAEPGAWQLLLELTLISSLNV